MPLKRANTRSTVAKLVLARIPARHAGQKKGRLAAPPVLGLGEQTMLHKTLLSVSNGLSQFFRCLSCIILAIEMRGNDIIGGVLDRGRHCMPVG